MLECASRGGGCLPGPGGGVSAWSKGGLLRGGVCLVRGGGWCVSQHALRQTPSPLPPCGQNSWHTLVKILAWPNFVAAGNNDIWNTRVSFVLWVRKWHILSSEETRLIYFGFELSLPRLCLHLQLIVRPWHLKRCPLWSVLFQCPGLYLPQCHLLLIYNMQGRRNTAVLLIRKQKTV